MNQGVYCDMNVNPLKPCQWLLFGPTCVFILQDKRLLILDRFQTLDIAHWDCCLDLYVYLLSHFYEVLFFFLSFPPQLRRRWENTAADRSRGGAPCRHFTTVTRLANGLWRPRSKPRMFLVVWLSHGEKGEEPWAESEKSESVTTERLKTNLRWFKWLGSRSGISDQCSQPASFCGFSYNLSHFLLLLFFFETTACESSWFE